MTRDASKQWSDAVRNLRKMGSELRRRTLACWLDDDGGADASLALEVVVAASPSLASPSLASPNKSSKVLLISPRALAVGAALCRLSGTKVGVARCRGSRRARCVKRGTRVGKYREPLKDGGDRVRCRQGRNRTIVLGVSSDPTHHVRSSDLGQCTWPPRQHPLCRRVGRRAFDFWGRATRA